MKLFSILTRPQATLGLAAILLLSACSTHIEYFIDAPYPQRSQDTPVEWLISEPTRPYVELASITVSGSLLSQDALRQRILDRARDLGADAVMSGGIAVAVRPSSSPYFEPGLLGPMGAAFNLYGYGWYTPYSSNPYLLTQGAVDIPRRETYLSAVAIRYEEESRPTQGR